MVNVDEDIVDFYKDNEGELRPFLNVTTAREDKLLGKWYTVKKAYLDEATDFGPGGEKIGTIDKWHLDFKEIPHKMTLNKTNFRTMKTDFGPETDNWVGQMVKFRVQKYSGYNDGLVIIDKQELEDMGETPPSSSSSDEPEVIKMVPDNEVNQIVDEQMKQPTKKDDKKDWFDKVLELTPKNQEDYDKPECRAAEWINQIRGDLIGSGVKPGTIDAKVIRDNVVTLVEDGTTSDHSLGKLDEAAGREIFKVLRIVDPI